MGEGRGREGRKGRGKGGEGGQGRKRKGGERREGRENEPPPPKSWIRPWNLFDIGKTRIIGLPYDEETVTMLSRFHLKPACDGQTDRIAILISRVSVLTRDNKITEHNQSSHCRLMSSHKVSEDYR